MKTLLVPLDGSRESAAVLPYAVTLARAGPFGMVLFSVWQADVPSAQRELDFRTEEVCVRGKEHLRRYLREVAGTLASHVPGVSVEVASGHPAVEIIAAAQALGADLIAISARGRRTLALERRGSVADKVIRTAQTPVLTVNPRYAPSADGPSAPVRRILVPTDLSPADELALHEARGLAKQLHARIDLVHVLPGPSGEGEDLEPAGNEVAKLRAEHQLRQHQSAYPDVIASFQIEHGRAAPEILRLAEDMSSDLIVMTSRGAAGGGLWPLGSVADEVIDGPVPTVIVPLPRS